MENKEKKVIEEKIWNFCSFANSEDNDIPTLKQMHVTDISYDIPSNTYTVTLCCPGILIGTGGRTINKLEKFLEAKIAIKEKQFYDRSILFG